MNPNLTRQRIIPHPVPHIPTFLLHPFSPNPLPMYIHSLKEAEKILKLEIQAKGSRIPGQKPANALGEIENLILGAAGDGDATVLSEGYARLAAWVDASLDAVRPELSRVLLPAFVHTYLNLVALGAIEEAQELKSLHGERFTDIPAQARQIAQLSTISLPEHLESSRAAVALKTKRHLVKMTAPSADLLSRFLRKDKRLLPLLSIINNHVELMLLEELPLGMGNNLPGEDGGGEGDDGLLLFMDVDDEFKQAVIAEASGVNAKPVDLRLLAGGLEDAYFADVAEKEEKEAQEKADKDDNTNKKQKKEFQKAADDARARKEAVGADRRPAPEIPLPPGFVVAPPDEKELRSAQFATLKARASVSPTDPPSCAFYTFLNTNQTLSSSVAFSQDGSLVAAGFDDASVRLYNMKAAQSPISGTTTNIASTAIHNNGPTFINTAPLADQHINDDDEEVTLASAALSSSASGPPVTFLHGHSAPVYGLDIMHPEDSLLLSCSGDGTIRLWSLEMLKGGGSLVAYKGHMLPVWDVASCPLSGYYFASGGADRAGRIWCTERSKALRLLAGHTSDVDVVKWHPGCHLVATGSADTTVRVWDVRTGGCVRLLTGSGGGGLSGRAGGVTAMSFSPSGMQLVTGDSLGAVSCWDLGTAKRLSTGGGGNRPWKGAVWSLAHSSGDGSVVASGGADCNVKLWSSGGSSTGGLSQFLTWQTKATPVLGLKFSKLNLLLGGGPLALRKPQRL